MITATFQHLKGIGKKTEGRFWDEGVLSWDIHDAKFPQKGGLLVPSRKAFDKRDLNFFARGLSKKNLYRLAPSFPEQVLFLDVKVPGSSFYYNAPVLVQWVKGDESGIWLRGQPPGPLLSALGGGGIIVSFGNMFRFLETHLGMGELPGVYLDLKSLSRRLGIQGDLRAVGEKIGWGPMENALKPILVYWQAHCQGEGGAMDELIQGSCNDLEGLGFLLDFCVRQLAAMDGVPLSVVSKAHCFSGARIECSREENSLAVSSLRVAVPKNRENVVMGIDLAASGESGVCILRGRRAETFRLERDGDFLRVAEEESVDLVCVDAPLGLPRGRRHCFDSDPAREACGITREYERILRRRGIMVYPSLIPSMQGLAHRGIGLKQIFHDRGFPIIEVYPGGAQDVLEIPRKQAGIHYLAQGLKSMGVQADLGNASHDELDAVTAALVGQFFLSDQYEALGDPQEGVLIMPDPGRIS